LATGAVAFAGLLLFLVGSFMMIAYTDPDAARHWRRLNVLFRYGWDSLSAGLSLAWEC
jgi:hypothetical protein